MMPKEKAQEVIAYVFGWKPVKKSVHRLLLICLHVLLWSLFLSLPLLIYRIEITNTHFLYRELINKSFLIVLFYFHYYYLIPRFFRKKKLLIYFLSLTAVLLVISAQQLMVEFYFQRLIGKGGAFNMVGRPGKMFHHITPVGKASIVPLVSDSHDRDSMIKIRQHHLMDQQGMITVADDPDAAMPAFPAAYGRPGIMIMRDSAGDGPELMIMKDSMDGPHELLTNEIALQGPGKNIVYIDKAELAGKPPGTVRKKWRFPKMTTVRLFGAEIPVMAIPLLMMDAITSAVIILLISGFIKLANSLLLSEKQKKILENERLNAELNFLKLQINPHFLFNTLNSIYSQAHLRSEQTEYSILKFSQIMRYVLYDSSSEKIPLSKDLEYIRNYIDLQKLRLSKNVTVHYEVKGNTDQLVIAPLLLITFIENAFKHGVSYTIPSELKIIIDVSGRTLSMNVENAIAVQRATDKGGVGLINAGRRLEVLYPGRHQLQIVPTATHYIVKLKIDLDHETELPDH